MKKRKNQYRSLKEFSVHYRFGIRSAQRPWRDDKIAFLERTLKASISGKPYLVIVHSPYPEPTYWEAFQRGKEIPYALSGRGVGKTALLEAFVEIAKSDERCEVLDFIDNRERLTEGVNFFEDFLIKEILNRRRGWKDTPLYWGVISMLCRFRLFLGTSLSALSSFVIWLTTILGLRIGQYFYNPNVRTGINNVIRVLSPYQGWLCVIGLVLFVLCCLVELEVNEELRTRYRALDSASLMENHKKRLRERLSSKPENLLSYISPHKCLVLVIDDIDYLDSRSFDSILDLFEAVRSLDHKYRMCVVLSFNPRNLALRLPERARIRELLADESVKATESWLPICITPLDLEQLIEILCEYFESLIPERFINIIGKEYPEALQRTGQLLGFFVRLETILAKQQRSLEEIQEEELLNEFAQYIYRDEREVERIISAIKAQDNTGGALELLKFVLAFLRHPARVEFVEKLLAEEGYTDLKLYEKILENAPIRLIHKVKEERWFYKFRERYSRYLLFTGWGEWKDQAIYYITKVFDLLCDEKKWEWGPEQALKSEPSKAAIEILYSQGLYFYQYYGHSDAGYALRFLGLDGGGALAKWLSLCEAYVREGEDLWDVIYWKATTFLNPYRNYRTSKSPPAWFFAPDLLITAATAYWLTGDTKATLNLLIDRWQWVKSHLSSNYPDEWPDQWVAECRKNFKRANAEIDLLLARILHHLGKGDSWTKAIERCRPYIRGELFADQQQLAQARFIAANIKHYRHFATGKLLPPLRFRPDSKVLEELLNVGRDKIADALVRLRALYSVSSSIWDECLKAPIATREAIKGIPFENIDHTQLDLFRQIVTEGIALVKDTKEDWSRLKERPQDIPPGGRAAEAELFFWEAVFLYQRCLLLAADIGCTVTQYRPTLDGGKWFAKLQAYDALAQLCAECVNCGLFSREDQATLLDRISKFRDWIRDLLKKERSAPPPITFKIIKQRLENLYTEVLDKASSQSNDAFLAADAIYRRLDHKQGYAEVLFQRGLMQFLTNSQPDRMPWKELLRKSNQVTDELGFHLDRLRSYLTIAKAAEASDVFLSIDGYRNSMPWCSDEGPGLPKVIIGELSYSLGHLFLIVEQVRGAQEAALGLMEKARRRYEPYLDGASFITREDAFKRMVDIRWNIAELTKRKAAMLAPDDESRIGLLNRAEENCNWIVNRTKGKSQFKSWEMQARVIKADLAHLKGDFKTAVQELTTLIEYYEREKDEFWLLQTLTSMCWSFKEAYESLSESEVFNYFNYLNKLVGVAMPYAKRFERDQRSLSVPEKVVFFQACHLLGRVGRRPDFAVKWLFKAFDILTSLGLFGNAILLDDDIHPVLMVHKGNQVQKAYEERLIRASLRIDPKSEAADWQRVGAILRRYFIQIPVTAHLQEKQDCLRAYEAMVRLGNMPGAISALEKGRDLIDQDNPGDVDLKLLERLHDAYRKAHDHEKVADVDRQRQKLKDIAQSRDFLLLAEKYLEEDWDAQWALEFATDVSFKDSQYYRRARRLLEKLRATSV